MMTETLTPTWREIPRPSLPAKENAAQLRSISLGAYANLLGDKGPKRALRNIAAGMVKEAPRSPSGSLRISIDSLLALGYTIERIDEATRLFSAYNKWANDRRHARNAAKATDAAGAGQ